MTDKTLATLSDEQLWILVGSLPLTGHNRLQELTVQSKRVNLTPDEQQELTTLIDQVDQDLLLRSQALLLLNQRGYNVKRQLQIWIDHS